LSAAVPPKAVEYSVGRPHGVCFVTGQAIGPGEACFAALRENPQGFERLEFTPAAWDQWPPQEKSRLLAFWRTTMPSKDPAERDKRRLLVDDEVLAELFRRLAEVTDPEKLAFRFMLGLILMRKKKLLFEGREQDAAGRDLWRVRFRHEEGQLEMIDPKLSETQLEEVGRQVGQILHGGIEEEALRPGAEEQGA
jgi:hypothetical protein